MILVRSLEKKERGPYYGVTCIACHVVSSDHGGQVPLLKASMWGDPLVSGPSLFGQQP